MNKLMIFILICLCGCTINMPSQEQVDNKVPHEIEMRPTNENPSKKPWPQEEKEYWYARYFFSMANNPRIQRLLTPESVFVIVKCMMAKYEEDHDFEWFLTNLGNTKILTAINNKYVYEVTKFCADREKKKNLKPIDIFT